MPEMPTWFLLLPFVAAALGVIFLLLFWLRRGGRDDEEGSMAESQVRLVVPDLLQRAASLKDEPGWAPLRPGVHVRRLYQTPDGGPTAALLRYQPGAGVPHHEHLGYEHVLVLDGAQSDEHGHYPAGTLIVNRPASAHRVASAEGCVALVIWERGVRFTGAE
jgi:anti-sigma factor ChrR (cupin superfamily)